MNDLILLLIEYLRQYNFWFLGVMIILQNNGLPLGANFLVMASGFFVYSGEFGLMQLFSEVLLFSLLGDTISYWIWHKSGVRILSRFPKMDKMLTPSLEKTKVYFANHGRLTILLTRFPVSGFGPVVNILMGISKYPYKSYIIIAALGESLWGAFNIGLGYWFGESWEDLTSLSSDMSELFLLIGVLTIALVVFRRLTKNG